MCAVPAEQGVLVDLRTTLPGEATKGLRRGEGLEILTLSSSAAEEQRRIQTASLVGAGICHQKFPAMNLFMPDTNSISWDGPSGFHELT